MHDADRQRVLGLERHPEVQAYLQFLGDLLLITALVYWFGGSSSPFTMLYLVVISVAATLLRRRAAMLVAGVDEAGRGPLAGPVVVAAVVFPPGRTPVNGLDDSKQLCPARREQLLRPRVHRSGRARQAVVNQSDGARTRREAGTLVSAGGRVLSVVALGHDLAQARFVGDLRVLPRAVSVAVSSTLSLGQRDARRFEQ